MVVTDGSTMTIAAKRLTAWVVAFGIALQLISAGFAATPAIAALVPAAIICHSGASDVATDRQAPSIQPDCCKQCVLCNTLSVGAAPDIFALFVPARLQAPAFIPFSACKSAPFGGLTIHAARGPPRSV
jgi:hypothetical protein